MEQSNLSKIFKALKLAYPYYFKNLTEEDSTMFLQLYYSKLKKYRYEIISKAIDNIITNNDFMPSLAEVLKECDKQSKAYYKNQLEKMYAYGYFKTDEEYGKAVMWLLEERPIIPEWLKKDVDNFIETNTIKQLKTEVNKKDETI
jgi:hypothetical protein